MELIRWGLAIMALFTSLDPISLLCVPDDRATPAAIDFVNPVGLTTTATEANLRLQAKPATANIRDSHGRPGAELKVSGTPTTRETYTANAVVHGEPVRSARFTITDSSGNVVGASEPYVLTSIDTVDGHASGSGSQRPALIATPDGFIWCALESKAAAPGTLELFQWDPDTELWGLVSTIWSASAATIGAGGYNAAPAIWWVKSDTASGYVLYVGGWFVKTAGTQVLRISASDDDGATWTSVDSNLKLAYSGTLSYDYSQIVWDSCSKGLTLQLLENDTGVLTSRHYISKGPGGAEWFTVTAGNIALVQVQSMVGFDGVTYLATVTAANKIEIRRRSGDMVGWEILTTDTGAAADVGYLVLVVNDSGWLYSIYRSSADEDEIMMQVSAGASRGSNWGDPTVTDGFPWEDSGEAIIVDDDGHASAALAEGIKPFAGAWSTETLFIAGNLVATAETVDNTLMAMRFGVMSTITTEEAASGVDAAWYPVSIPPTKSPQYTALTTSGATTSTITLDSLNRLVGTLSVDNSTGYETYIYVGDPTAAAFDWAIGKDTTGGGGAGTNDIAALFRCHNVANTLRYAAFVTADIDTGEIRVFDAIAPGQVAADTTPTANEDLIIRAALNGNTGKISVYYRQPGDTSWTPVLENHTLTSGAGIVTTRVEYGKYTASVDATIDSLYFIPYGSGATGFVNTLATGFASTSLIPIRATTRPQRNIFGHHFWWEGSPLPIGGVWNVSSFDSQTGLQLTSPLCAVPSPSRPSTGTSGAGGATSRVALNYGTYQSRLSNNLVHLGWWNMRQAASITLGYWDGAAIQAMVTGSCYYRPFGANGAVAFTRSSAGSYLFRPNGVNGTPKPFWPQDIEGWWCRIADPGGNAVASYIKKLHPGQFCNTSGIQQMAIELDPDELIEESGVGAFAALSTGTATGNIVLCRPDGIAIGTDDVDSQGYYFWTEVLAPGVTVPSRGLVTFGPAYILSVAERDGGSRRFATQDEIRVIPESGFAQGQRIRRRPKRTVEMPYEQILLHSRYEDAAGTAVNTISMDGAAPRSMVDSNLDVIELAHRDAGQRMPVAMVINGDFGSTDPGATETVFHGQDIILGFMEAQIDRVASHGPVMARDPNYYESGRLLIRELV